MINDKERVKEVEHKLKLAHSQLADLKSALEEALAFNAHYAVLLNQFDGGERKTFTNIEAWLTRIAECGTPMTNARN